MPQHRVRTQVSLGKLILAVALCAVVSWFLREIRGAREAARRSQCIGNLKQLALAFHNYHAAYGTFPPAYIAASDGTPLHSWRILILPFLEERGLYNRYNFNEPWNGPNNSQLAHYNPFAGLPARMPSIYVCPSDDDPSKTVLTDYVLVTGPGTVFPGAASTKLGDIRDGSSITLLIVEAAGSKVHWMEPRDLDIGTMSLRLNNPGRPCVGSPHRGGANAAFCDGSVRFLPDSLTSGTVKAFITANGGENVRPR